MTKKLDGKEQIFSMKLLVPLDEWENSEKIPLEMWVEVETCSSALRGPAPKKRPMISG